MPQVHIKYFASVREALNVSSETVQTAAATVGELRAELMGRSGGYAQALGDGANGVALRAAYQQTLCDWHTPFDLLASSHEVAFFPPVTGG